MFETNTEQVQETVVESPSPFAQNAWSTDIPTPPATTETQAEIKPTQETPAATTETKPEPTSTTNEWYKNFGWDNEDAAKNEITKLKEQKPQEEIKWANEDSKKVHELLREGKIEDVVEIYNKQKQLDRVIKSEVNTQSADEIIKLQMKLKYPTLNDNQIDFQFNEDYGTGKKPVQKESELDEEFNERLAEYNERVERVNMKKTIAATMAIPELQKLKSEIVLPDLSKSEQATSQLTEAQLQQMRDNFLKALDGNYSKVEGFSTRVKDESVDYPVVFKIPDEDKVAIKERLAQEGLDVNDYMDKRWFGKDGVPNIEKIITDIYQLENLDKILSGVANKSANERWEAYTKSTKNLNVNTSSTPTPTFQQNGNGNVSPFAKDAWSDKPPLIQN